jgi:glucosamine--fructose-6-phosphate aminotransferase (isomerizing)
VVFVAPDDPLYTKTANYVEEVRARKARVIAITSPGDRVIAPRADWVITVPSTPELLSPLVTVLPAQLLAYEIAALRGADVDQPRNLAKTVTVE